MAKLRKKRVTLDFDLKSMDLKTMLKELEETLEAQMKKGLTIERFIVDGHYLLRIEGFEVMG